MKKFLVALAAVLLIVPLGFAGFVWYRLQPQEQYLELPDGLVDFDTEAGRALLASAECTADYPGLSRSWEAQELVSYCGVASGVTVLKALGQSANQFSFFNDDTDAVRSRMQVTLGGMSLPDLAGLLHARGVDTVILHGDQFTVEEFRQLVASNLCREGDYMLVNYQREALGQGRVGHISPLGAYDRTSDRVLIMDTADYKYPFTWVPLPSLHAAMQERDASSGHARGAVEVRAEMPGG